LKLHSVATGIYNTSDLELHVLEQTVTITHITTQSKVIDHRRSSQGTLWRKKSQKENHVRSEFYGSVPLINAVTII
jgi:hypothetical protein